MEGICLSCKKECSLHARGLCRNCYQRLMGLPNFDELYPSKQKNKLKKCKVEGCNNNSRANGYCGRHYSQIYNYGDLLDTNPNRSKFDNNEIIINQERNLAEIVIYNNQGYEKCRALIDIEDIDRVKYIKWNSDEKNYIGSSNHMQLHRYIMNCDDNNLVVDHINRNPLDNRKCNLRICTQQENSRNKCILPFNSTGIVGVYYNKKYDDWYSGITHNNHFIYLGSFKNKEDAIKERLKAEVYYFGEFAPQIHMFKEYGIDLNGNYKIKEYTPQKNGNKLGIKGIFKGSGNYKDKWKVEFKLNKKKIYLGHYDTLEDAIKSKEDYIKNNAS